MKNIVERMIVPRDAAAGSLEYRDTFALFAPVAGTNRIGMAKFSSKEFDIQNQTVSLRADFVDTIMRKVDLTKPLPDGIAFEVNGYKTPGVIYDGYENEVAIGYENGEYNFAVRSGTLFVVAYEKKDVHVMTELFLTEGDIWLRRVVIQGSSSEVTPFLQIDNNLQPYIDSVNEALGRKLDKVTTSLADYVRFYSIYSDGTQTITKGSRNAGDGMVKLAAENGHIRLPNETLYEPDDDFAVSKRYCDRRYPQLKPFNNYTACVTVNPDGKQGTSAPYTGGAVDGFLVCRRSGAQILAPNQMSNVPGDDEYVSKRWVENRVLALEHDLIDFDESTVTASRRTAPITAAPTAYLTKLHGKATASKNKFDPYLFEGVFSNFEVDDDGTIHGDAYWTNDDQMPLADIYLPAGEWTIRSTGTNSLPVYFSPYHDYNLSNGGGTITLSAPTNVSVWYTQYWSEDFVRYSFKVMLNAGDTTLPYEPYGYFPTIVTAVKSYGANLLPYPLGFPASRVNEGITFTNNGDGTVSATGTSTAAVGSSSYVQWNTGLQLKAGVPYTATGVEGALTSPLTCRLRLIFQNGSPTQDVYGKTTFILNKDDSPNVLLIVSGGVTVKDYVFAPMITSVQGDVPYAPPLPRPFSTYQIPTKITSLPDYGLSMPDGSSANTVDFDNMVYWRRCTKDGLEIKVIDETSTPLSNYLTVEELRSIGDHVRIQVQGGGDIEFLGHVGSSAGSDEPVEIGTTMTFLLK